MAPADAGAWEAASTLPAGRPNCAAHSYAMLVLGLLLLSDNKPDFSITAFLSRIPKLYIVGEILNAS